MRHKFFPKWDGEVRSPTDTDVFEGSQLLNQFVKSVSISFRRLIEIERTIGKRILENSPCFRGECLVDE